MSAAFWPPPAWFPPFFWYLVAGCMVLALLFALNKVMGGELHHFAHMLKDEWRESAAGEHTVGALNWRGARTIFVFGVIAIVCVSTQKIFGFLGAWLGVEKAKDLLKYTDFMTLVYFLGGFLALSLIAVVVDNRSRK